MTNNPLKWGLSIGVLVMKDFKQDENLKALFEELSKPEQQQIVNNYQQDMTEYWEEVELLLKDEEKKKEFIKEFFDLKPIEKVESEDYYL